MDTTLTGSPDNDSGRRMSPWRIAAWITAALLLLLPLVAMQFTEEVNWTPMDFLFAAVLLFGSLGAYEVAVRKTGNTAYRAGVGVAIAAAFLLTWVNAAVALTDSDADGVYFLVLALGVAGAFGVRFRAAGMARVLLATALAVAAVGVIALVAGIVPAYNSAAEVLGLSGFFAALFGGAALLFRAAAHAESVRSTP